MRDRIVAARARGRRNRFRSRSLGAAAATLTASGAAVPASAAIIYDLSVSYSPNDTFDLTGDAASTIDLFTITGMMGELDLGLETGGGMMGTVEFSFDLGSGPLYGWMQIQFDASAPTLRVVDPRIAI